MSIEKLAISDEVKQEVDVMSKYIENMLVHDIGSIKDVDNRILSFFKRPPIVNRKMLVFLVSFDGWKLLRYGRLSGHDKT